MATSEKSGWSFQELKQHCEWNGTVSLFSFQPVSLIRQGVEDVSVHRMPVLAQGDELQK